jgi:nitronate monooxygenase
VLGADLAYLRTRFISTNESLAGDDYRSAVVTANTSKAASSRTAPR